MLVCLPRAGRRQRRDRDDAITRSLPELIDLLSLGVTAGLTLRQAAEAVVSWLPHPCDEAIGRALERSGRGEPWADALCGATRELGPSTQYVFSVLIAAEGVNGTVCGPSLGVERLLALLRSQLPLGEAHYDCLEVKRSW
ncbi:MAG: hypothetical protein HOM37_15765, partial [Acidimicrobiaceae bacterium]|nr:hypothetical protein [Acidimicrobiaceae bacterium]